MIDTTTNWLFVSLCDEDQPQSTIRGPKNLKALRKRVIIDETVNEHTTAVEYREYFDDEIIRRDVHVHLHKPMVFAEGQAAKLSG